MKVSVIIPAYNCADYIGDAISSVLEQTMPDFELIIVNDGSTDLTQEVLDEYSNLDRRIRVIPISNAGPANARNVGINDAWGDYLYFMDADDTIEPDMLREMTELAYALDLDEVCCGYLMENMEIDPPEVKEFNFESFLAETPDSFRSRLLPMIKAHLMYVVWNKLFRRRLILDRDIQFKNYKSGEDRLFNIDVFPHIKSFGFIGQPFYRYYLRGGSSLAGKYLANRFEAALVCHQSLIAALRQMELYDENAVTDTDFVFVKGVMSCFTQMFSPECPLSHSQKLTYIGKVMENDAVQDAIGSVDEQFGYSKWVSRILRTGNRRLIYLLAKSIYKLQTKQGSLYLKMKHKQKEN